MITVCRLEQDDVGMMELVIPKRLNDRMTDCDRATLFYKLSEHARIYAEGYDKQAKAAEKGKEEKHG